MMSTSDRQSKRKRANRKTEERRSREEGKAYRSLGIYDVDVGQIVEEEDGGAGGRRRRLLISRYTATGRNEEGENEEGEPQVVNGAFRFLAYIPLLPN
ncbi:hypothetical protein LXL04_018160 [Taraxacum kok-saghyz]